MNKSNQARKFREQIGWEMPTLTAAKLLFKKNNLLFKDVEDARKVLRYIEGKDGAKSRRNQKGIPERPKNPYKLPDSSKEDRKIFHLPTGCNNILLLSDLHIPYQDNASIELALRYGQENDVNTIFINGDLLDFHHLSKFQHDPRKRNTLHEFGTAKAMLQSIRAAFPLAEIYWLKGNHDMRYEHWLMSKAPEVFDDPYYHLEERLKLNEERIKLIDDKTLVKAGLLSITHGHLIMKGFFAPVNAARGAWMKAKQSLLISHVHKVSKHVEVDIDGKVHACWSTGCLCELWPDYNPLVSNYQTGFAHILINDDKTYSVLNHQIIDGKIH